MKKIELNKNELTKFIKGSKQHIKNIDKIMEMPESKERGNLVAKSMNNFELMLDIFLTAECKVDFQKLSTVLNKSFKLP